jgi:hypothetical protein
VVFGHPGWCLGTRGGVWAPGVVFGHPGWCLGTRGGVWAPGVVFGHPGWCRFSGQARIPQKPIQEVCRMAFEYESVKKSGCFFLRNQRSSGTGTYETNGTNATHGTGSWDWDYGT